MEAVILMGIQAAGKSSFCREYFFKTHVRINLDMLRTRHREAILVQACLEAKQPFVIDNTNPTVSDRAKYIQRAQSAHFRIVGYFVEASLESALARNAQRQGKERIPAAGIRSTYHRFEIPSWSEGFDALFQVTLHDQEQPIGFRINDWPPP